MVLVTSPSWLQDGHTQQTCSTGVSPAGLHAWVRRLQVACHELMYAGHTAAEHPPCDDAVDHVAQRVEPVEPVVQDNNSTEQCLETRPVPCSRCHRSTTDDTMRLPARPHSGPPNNAGHRVVTPVLLLSQALCTHSPGPPRRHCRIRDEEACKQHSQHNAHCQRTHDGSTLCMQEHLLPAASAACQHKCQCMRPNLLDCKPCVTHGYL